MCVVLLRAAPQIEPRGCLQLMSIIHRGKLSSSLSQDLLDFTNYLRKHPEKLEELEA